MSDVKAWVFDISVGVRKLFQYLSETIIAKAEWAIDALPQCNEIISNTYASPAALPCQALDIFSGLQRFFNTYLNRLSITNGDVAADALP